MSELKFNEYIEQSIKDYWDLDALADYMGETFQYKDIARIIEKLHIIFEYSNVQRRTSETASCRRIRGCRRTGPDTRCKKHTRPPRRPPTMSAVFFRGWTGICPRPFGRPCSWFTGPGVRARLVSKGTGGVCGLASFLSAAHALPGPVLGMVRGSEDLDVVLVLELVTALRIAAPADLDDLSLGDALGTHVLHLVDEALLLGLGLLQHVGGDRLEDHHKDGYGRGARHCGYRYTHAVQIRARHSRTASRAY